MTATYLERLAARSAATGTVLCLGIDPDTRALPRGMPALLASVEDFAMMLVRAASPFAAAVKANSAFFEAHGSAGIAVLERVRAAVPCDCPVHPGRQARRHRLHVRALRGGALTTPWRRMP